MTVEIGTCPVRDRGEILRSRIRLVRAGRVAHGSGQHGPESSNRAVGAFADFESARALGEEDRHRVPTSASSSYEVISPLRLARIIASEGTAASCQGCNLANRDLIELRFTTVNAE